MKGDRCTIIHFHGEGGGSSVKHNIKCGHNHNEGKPSPKASILSLGVVGIADDNCVCSN